MGTNFQFRTKERLVVTVRATGIKWDSNWVARTPGAPMEQFRASRFAPYIIPRDRIGMVTLSQSASRGKFSVALDILGAPRITFPDVSIYTLKVGKQFNMVEMFRNLGYPVNGQPGVQQPRPGQRAA